MILTPAMIVLTMSCFMLIAGLLGTAFWIWMLVDCATKEPDQNNEKLIWILVIVLTHFIGAAIYFFIRRPQRKLQFGR